ncbi:MAG: ThiF family adenylyltransferase [Candidatus Hodarchaeales archaeon]
MSEDLSSLFERQLGLVYQERIEDLRVLLTGHGPTMGFLVQELVFLGFGSSQGFVSFPNDLLVTKHDVKGQLLLEESDIGKPFHEAIKNRTHEKISDDVLIFGVSDLDDFNYDAVVAVETALVDIPTDYRIPSFENAIWAITTKTSACISTEKLHHNQSPFNVLTPSLCAITASLAATEILRRNLLIRVSEILDSNLQLRFILQQKGILEACKTATADHKGLPFKLRLKLGSERVPVTFEEYTETTTIYGSEGRKEKINVDPDRVILYASFPKTSFLKRLLVDQLEILEEYPSGHFKPVDNVIFSPFNESRIENNKIIDVDLKIPETLDNKKIYFLGVGGLGSWTTVLINLSNTSNCTMVLNDHDPEIEEHNLNRQILFTKASIGKPKAVAAEESLIKINPTNKITLLPFQLDIGAANNIVNNEFMTPEEYEHKKKNISYIPGTSIPTEIIRDDLVVANELKESDIIVCGPDNIRVRYVTSLIGKLVGIPVVNAGAERFEGKMDLFEPNHDCYVCRYGENSKYKQEVVSCTGRIPIPSIVTTISTLGGIQALITMVKLAMPDTDCVHYLQYYGRYQMFAKCSPDGPCRHKQKEACPHHLNLPEHENPFSFFK